MASGGIWKTLSAETISLTLKFGFQQRRLEYSVADSSNSIVDRLYHDAEKLLRDLANSFRSGQLQGCYTYHLFRIPATEFAMVPILQQSDVEQNSLIEIVLVPVKMNQNPHKLYRCQLTVPTNCSRCTGFIAGVYRQGYRCHKCRMTYHKDCAPFLVDDCIASANGDAPKKAIPGQLIFINPFVVDSTSPPYKPHNSPKAHVPLFRTSTSTTQENAEIIPPNKIIEKGIFPAGLRGAPFPRRYLFRSTTTTLILSTNLAPENVSQEYLPQSTTDTDSTILLTNIHDLVLTHLTEDHDDVFEIHLHDMIISVGKKTDSDELQMNTAQFYSTIRDLRETLINANPPAASPLPPPPPTPPSSATPVPGSAGAVKKKGENLQPLGRKISNYRLAPLEKDNEPKDLHELYAFTGEKIGEGAFGRVVGALKKSTQQPVAIKIIEKTNCGDKEIQRINDEINNLYKFTHVNILKLEAYYERDDAVYLVTERMELDMVKYINKAPNGHLNEDISRMIGYQLLVAVRYLHGNNCGHLDIKCENILISLLKPISGKNADHQNGLTGKDEYPLVKLADFGYSRIIGEHSFRKTRVGTRLYNAPEIYYSTVGYNRKADMWSVGIVLYAALSGALPYDEKGSQQAEQIVGNTAALYSGPRWNKVSKEAKGLISEKLLVIPPASRSTSNDALFHEWFTGFDLYLNLREIEKRTKHLMSTRSQDLASPYNWLTGEREDELWTSYREAYAQMSVSQ